jgi:serine/threonine protein kinase
MIERINMEFELKNYEIKGLLGEGGMAVVYLAEQTTLHREVSLLFFEK